MLEKESRIKELVSILNEASDAYYNGKGEVMTDFEWDALFDELKQLEEETNFILPDSPTQNVSSDTTVGEKEPHEYVALSLAKTKLVSDLVKWAENRPIWISWKLDGLTLVATYDNGKLTKVLTRGDGHIGTNITHLVDGIQGIPKTIPSKQHVVVRGEAVISYEDFERFRMESDEDYANPRNLASGSLALKDVEEVKRRNIHWIPFTLVHTDETLHTFEAQMNFLEEQGFTCVEREKITTPTEEVIQGVIEKWTQKVTGKINPYPVDGLVICYDDADYAATGSVTGHHATRAGYAFKWQDETRESVLQEIEWSCAASTITPVAIFEPVELEGTIVKRASLCNISECERLGIGDAGTELTIIKANKIIPKVVRVTKTVGSLHVPEQCPVCGAKSEVVVSQESDTKTLRCTNAECVAKKLKKFTRFVSKAGMDIDGISEQTLSRFINEGWIKQYGDIYRLVNHVQEIALLDGFGEKSAQNLNNAITKARHVLDTKFLFALCIPAVGQDVAKRLLTNYSLEELVSKAVETDNEEYFAHIDGIGPEKSASFIRYFKDEKNLQEYQDVLKEITIEAGVQQATGKRCEGLTFVVTGDVYHFKNRNELKAYIESQGGKVTSAVSASTSYLINNDTESTSSKNQKAKALGIQIISEDAFIERFQKEE